MSLGKISHITPEHVIYSWKPVTSLLIVGPPTGDDCSLHVTSELFSGAFSWWCIQNNHDTTKVSVPQSLWLIFWRTIFLVISIRIREELEVVWNQESLNFAIVSFWIWQLKDELPKFQTQQVQVKRPSLPLVPHFRTCRAEWAWSLASRNVQ